MKRSEIKRRGAYRKTNGAQRADADGRRFDRLTVRLPKPNKKATSYQILHCEDENAAVAAQP